MQRKQTPPAFPGSRWTQATLKSHLERSAWLSAYQLSDKDVNAILEAKRGSGSGKAVPLHVQKVQLLSRIALLESSSKSTKKKSDDNDNDNDNDNDDDDDVAVRDSDNDDALEDLEKAKQDLARVSESLQRAHSPAKQNLSKWSALNARNRSKNAQEIRRAQQKTLLNQLNSTVSAASSAASNQQQQKKIDVFARRRARNVHSFIQAIEGKQKTDEPAKPAVKQQQSPVLLSSNLQKQTVPVMKVNAHDLHADIDLDLEISPIDREL